MKIQMGELVSSIPEAQLPLVLYIFEESTNPSLAHFQKYIQFNNQSR